jgi:DNA-3-methyladenine glycosylase
VILGPILPRSFYARSTVEVARALLGKVLVHGPTAGIIFGPPGHAYVYLIYGMYQCLNLVAEVSGRPGCVLIRALQPVSGVKLMRARRGAVCPLEQLANGPGKLTLALGITRAQNGADVTRGALVVRHAPGAGEIEIAVTPRIGISRSAELPLRFLMAGSGFVSARRRSAPPPAKSHEESTP